MKSGMHGVGAVIATGILLWNGDSRAQTQAWNVNASGQWTDVGNWAGATNFPDGIGHVADFTFNVTAARTITLDDSAGDGVITIGTLRLLEDDYRYLFTVNAGTTWVFEDTDGTAEIDILGGSGTSNRKLQINSDITINSDLLITHREAGANPSCRFIGNILEGVAGHSLIKAGPGTIWLEGTANHSADTFLNGGEVNLWYGGALAATTNIVFRNGTALIIDNGANGNLADRLNDAASIQSYGGTLAFEQNAAAATDYSETMGGLYLRDGQFTLTVEPSDAAQLSTLTFASMFQEGKATARIEALGLGGDSNRVVVAAGPDLVNEIVPWLLLRTGNAGVGADYDLATTNSAAGGAEIVAYTGYATDGATWGDTVNARPSASAEINAAKSVYTLVLDDGVNLTCTGGDKILTVNGAIVQTGGSSTIDVNGAYEVVLQFGAGTGIFNVIGNLAVVRDSQAQQIRGTGGLIKTGPGTLSLDTSARAADAANPLSGLFSVNEGTLELKRSNAAGGTVLELNGGTIVLRNNSSTVFRGNAAVTPTNTSLVVSRDGTLKVSRNTAGTSGITHTIGDIWLADGVKLTVQPDNSLYTDSNENSGLNANDVILAGDAAIDIKESKGSGDMTMSVTNVTDNGNGYSLTITGNDVNQSQFFVEGTITLGGDLTIGTKATVRASGGLTNVAGNVELKGGIVGLNENFFRALGAGAGQVRLTGSGTEQSGFSSYNSPTIVHLGGAGAPAVWGTEFFDPGIFVLNQDDANNTIEFQNPIDLNVESGTVTRQINVHANVATISGAITNSGAGTADFLKSGGQTLYLTGPLGWNGQTRIIGGHIRLDSPTNLPSGNLSLNPGNSTGVLESKGVFTRALGAGDNQVSIVGTGTANSRPGFSAYGGDFVIDLGGDGTGTGAELVWGTADFSPDAAGNTGALLLNTGNADGILYVLNDIDLNADGSNGVRRFEVNTSLAVLAGDVQNSQAGFHSVGLYKRGAGILVLAGNNTYDGGTTINNGTLVIGAGGTSGTLPAGGVTNSGTLAFNRSDTLTIDNPITGSGAVAQLGGGTLDLTADNSYTGPTIVSNGTLRINGAYSGGGLITVVDGATLGGSGSAAGVTLESGGRLAPGNSAGTLTLSGDLDLSAVGAADNGSLVFELGSGSQDLVVLTGGQILIGNDMLGFSDFAFSDLGDLTVGVYTLFSTPGTVSGTLDASDLTGSIGGLTGTLGLADGDSDIVLTVVPEPASLGIIGVLAGAVFLRRRR